MVYRQIELVIRIPQNFMENDWYTPFFEAREM